MHFAVTQDGTVSVLPSSVKWVRWFSQPVNLDVATPESELKTKLEPAFKHNGFYMYPRKK
ncbi:MULTISPECIES: hypothetical protein [unclassified Bradyrhizobium]|uniref:hypothetical protein n=1 Tax=unclassified Bradyrhizobium TaxID=2631580 RepID=UPI002916F201|nr:MULTISPECIES: hypothetical protein [unclassified Bradyrhizobium]